MFQAKVVDKIKMNISSSVIFFYLNHAIYEIMWKNIVEPATYKNMLHAHCLLDT